MIPFMGLFKKLTVRYYSIKSEDNQTIAQCRVNMFPLPNITYVLLVIPSTLCLLTTLMAFPSLTPFYTPFRFWDSRGRRIAVASATFNPLGIFGRDTYNVQIQSQSYLDASVYLFPFAWWTSKKQRLWGPHIKGPVEKVKSIFTKFQNGGNPGNTHKKE